MVLAGVLLPPSTTTVENLGSQRNTKKHTPQRSMRGADLKEPIAALRVWAMNNTDTLYSSTGPARQKVDCPSITP